MTKGGGDHPVRFHGGKRWESRSVEWGKMVGAENVTCDQPCLSLGPEFSPILCKTGQSVSPRKLREGLLATAEEREEFPPV